MSLTGAQISQHDRANVVNSGSVQLSGTSFAARSSPRPSPTSSPSVRRGGPTKIVSGAGSLWTDVPNIPGVVRIDPGSDTIIATIPSKGACADIEADDGAVWVAGGDCQPGITRIDPGTNTVTTRLNAGGKTNAVALAGGTAWYATSKSNGGATNFLGRVDTTGSAVVGQLKLPGPAFEATAAFGFVWVVDRDDALLFRIRPD